MTATRDTAGQLPRTAEGRFGPADAPPPAAPPAGGPPPRGPRLWDLLREQVVVAGGQIAAGVGNLLFALALARLLSPGDFAVTSAFLALYLVISVPAGSLGATAALTPDAAVTARRRVLGVGATAGLAVAVLGLPLSAVLDVPVPVVLVLAAALPGIGLIEMERGRLYGLARHGRAVASLAIEPLVRLTAGLGLAALLGPVGAAAGIVLAGWAALAVAATAPRTHRLAAPAAPAAAPAPPDSRWGVAAAFLALALVQNTGILLANALLPGAEAGRFAVAATLGGIAAFATVTVPLVLLGRGERDDRGALWAAVGVAAALGAGATLVVALGGGTLVALAFGERYRDVAGFAAVVVAAMALLGVARVLVADRVARGERGVLAVLLVPVALQVVLVPLAADDAPEVAAFLALSTVVLLASSLVRGARLRAALQRTPVRAVLGLMVAGLVLRLLTQRGIWLDEATTIFEARLPLGRMFEVLRTTDVHPPLHHLLVWLAVRAFGVSEWTVRIPSLIAGVALIPALYAAGRELYSERAGLAAATLGTAAPLLIWYAQEARMYALVMLFATLAVWAQARAIRTGGVRWWALYAVSTAGMLYSHYFTALFVAVQQLGFLLALRDRRRSREPLRPLLLAWAGALLAVALLVAPLLPLTYGQFAANEASGRGFEQSPSRVVGGEGALNAYTVITNAAWATFGYHSSRVMGQAGALWPFAMLFVLALLGRGRSRATSRLTMLVLVPAALLFLIGLRKRDLFEVRYFIAAVPMIVLLAGHLLTSWVPRGVLRWGVIGVIAAGLVAADADQQLNGANPRIYDFRGALAAVRDGREPGDRVVYEPQYLNNVVDFYAPGIGAKPLGDKFPQIPRHGRLYLLGSFRSNPETAQRLGRVVGRLRDRHRLLRVIDRPQVRVWVFER